MRKILVFFFIFGGALAQEEKHHHHHHHHHHHKQNEEKKENSFQADVANLPVLADDVSGENSGESHVETAKTKSKLGAKKNDEGNEEAKSAGPVGLAESSAGAGASGPSEPSGQSGTSEKSEISGNVNKQSDNGNVETAGDTVETPQEDAGTGERKNTGRKNKQGDGPMLKLKGAMKEKVAAAMAEITKLEREEEKEKAEEAREEEEREEDERKNTERKYKQGDSPMLKLKGGKKEKVAAAMAGITKLEREEEKEKAEEAREEEEREEDERKNTERKYKQGDGPKMKRKGGKKEKVAAAIAKISASEREEAEEEAEEKREEEEREEGERLMSKDRKKEKEAAAKADKEENEEEAREGKAREAQEREEEKRQGDPDDKATIDNDINDEMEQMAEMESEGDRKAEEEEEKEEEQEKELDKVKKIQEEKRRNAEQSNFGKSYREAMKRRFFGKSRSRIDTYPALSTSGKASQALPVVVQQQQKQHQQQQQQQQAAEKKLKEGEEVSANSDKASSPSVIEEFANIAKDIHESKSDKTTAASKESPKSERTESGNGEGSAADAETEEKGGEHAKAEGTGGEATPAGEEKGGGAAAEGKSGESDAGSGSAEIKRRIDRDYRTLHHLLSRLNHRQKDRNLGAIANVLSKSIVDTRLSSLGESIVPRNSANYKKAAVERVEAVDREDDEEVKKKTWWEKAIKKLKTKTNAASPEDKRDIIFDSMAKLLLKNCEPQDPVNCFVLGLTEKNVAEWHAAGKEEPKDSIQKGEPKIAAMLWDLWKFDFIALISSQNDTDHAAGVLLYEELRQWGTTFDAIFVENDNCTVLPEQLIDMWKCVKCIRQNGSSRWYLDSTTDYNVCIKHEHDMEKEAAKCGKEIMELKKNTTLFLSCLHGVSYRAMLAAGQLRAFIEKLLLRLDDVLSSIERDRGDSVFRLLKGRNIGNDEDGNCKNKPENLQSIEETCIFCQDKMWILKDDAVFKDCFTGSRSKCGPVCIYTIVALVIAFLLIILIIALVIVPMCRKGGKKSQGKGSSNQNENARVSNRNQSNFDDDFPPEEERSLNSNSNVNKILGLLDKQDPKGSYEKLSASPN